MNNFEYSHNTGSYPGSVGEFSAFVVDLRSQFSGRRQYQTKWVLLAATSALCYVRRTAFVHLIQYGYQEGGSLARASLGACHHVSLPHDYRNRVLLYRCGSIVASHRDVAADNLSQLYFLKLKRKY